jgi:hypothetical protein
MNKAFEILTKYGCVKVTIYQNRDYTNSYSFLAYSSNEIHPLMESISDDIRFEKP